MARPVGFARWPFKGVMLASAAQLLIARGAELSDRIGVEFRSIGFERFSFGGAHGRAWPIIAVAID